MHGPQPNHGSPSVPVLMRMLADAGDEGLAVGAMVRRFTYPVRNMSRNARINDMMRRQASRGHVRRSETKEPSVYYQNTPQYRWFITARGGQWVAAGFPNTRSSAEARERRAQRRATRLKAERLQSAAMERYHGSRVVSRSERQQVITDLRRGGCSWRQCGEVFGVTAEMARHIHAGRGRGTPRRQLSHDGVMAQLSRAIQGKMGDLGVTQSAIAGKLGVSVSQVSYALGGRTSSPLALMERMAAEIGLRFVIEDRNDG